MFGKNAEPQAPTFDHLNQTLRRSAAYHALGTSYADWRLAGAHGHRTLMPRPGQFPYPSIPPPLKS